ncbi:symplekin isoform X2 [Coccinella septempunctata]|uniref:symplekin isoform X2 n=1 Tax=Coccinella septempunctata TaxID=41139 RepID=UPI001D08F017|nr:symplekin isoform X2 [Coccinella septempunctata]
MDSDETSEFADDQTLVQWLNDIGLIESNTDKLEYFFKIQEMLLRKSPNLLPKYLSHVLNFTTNKSGDLKKALVGFIEEFKMKETYLPIVIVNLYMLLCDECIAVQKRVIQATITIYRRMLAWLCKATHITEDMNEAWIQLNQIKREIANMIDSDNDGIRTSAVKFLECVILLQTYPDEVENRKQNDFSLDDVPLTLKIARRRKLEEEASNLFEVLLKFHNSTHISSANLLTCLGVLTNLAKTRAEFMSKVVTAIISLYKNLPPTLSTTQVNSVRKKLKTELSGLMKHPGTFDFIDQLTPILLDLGCSQSDINRMLPKTEERKRYAKRTLSFESLQLHQPKRQKIDDHVDIDFDDFKEKGMSPQEVNEKFVSEKLTLQKVIEIVEVTLNKLPDTMPSTFGKDYEKLVKAGSVGNEEITIMILANLLTEYGVGPGGRSLESSDTKKRERENDDEKGDEDKAKKEKIKISRMKILKLGEIIKPLERENKENMLVASVKRLLSCGNIINHALHQKIISTLAACFCPLVKETIITFLINDLRAHIDIALAWLFEEYSIMQGFSRKPPLRKDAKIDQSYNILLCTLVSTASNDSFILSKILLEAPLVTEEALDQVKVLCRDENRCEWVLALLKELTLSKPPKQLTFLNVLLLFSTYEQNIVRDCALKHILELHKREDLKVIIEEFARMNLEFLKLKRPPEGLCGFNQGRLKSESWGDDFIKACLMPFISLLPADQALIHDLADIYIQTSADIKRIILRLLDAPIREMGMQSQELLKLMKECSKGSETLVTRIIHILTEKEPPSLELVQIVRDLYNSKVSDVRFLIPVLNGLSKKEILTALPKMIKLNPIVVKEVFNRLLGSHGDSPVSPTELLVSLHTIDSLKADLKTVIKATSLCLQDKQIFSQEVMAVVLQQLMEQSPLPTLLMRTVIQALGSYPRLSGFVMNILQRLIIKQVWKQKVVWEGFVKCCQRTKPQSFAVLMQLPPPQLTEALNMCPELRDPLKEHLLSLTEGQLAHIPSAVKEILLNSYRPVGLSTPEQAIINSADSVQNRVVPPPVAAPTVTEPLPPGME